MTFHVFFISTKFPAINASRIANRVINGGHDLPISKFISRYAKSILNCQIIGRFVDRLYVYGNSVEDRVTLTLFRLRNGNIWVKCMWGNCRNGHKTFYLTMKFKFKIQQYQTDAVEHSSCSKTITWSIMGI